MYYCCVLGSQSPNDIRDFTEPMLTSFISQLIRHNATTTAQTRLSLDFNISQLSQYGSSIFVLILSLVIHTLKCQSYSLRLQMIHGLLLQYLPLKLMIRFATLRVKKMIKSVTGDTARSIYNNRQMLTSLVVLSKWKL